MKSEIIKFLACPICSKELKPVSFEEDEEMKNGVLVCSSCKIVYPVYDYVPRLFVFPLPEYSEFKNKWKDKLKKIGCEFANGTPEKGEQFIQRSFSIQWLEKDYDDYIWGFDPARLRAHVLKQIGFKEKEFAGKIAVDIGCGNGSITNLFFQFGAEAIGLDLSYSVIKSAQHFRKNKKIHFVQASLFHPPFKKKIFDIVYSTGVLHHTYDTRKAFFSIVGLCKNKGRVYIWLYGDYKGFVKIFNIVTDSIRKVVSRLPPTIQDVTTKALATFYGFAHTYLRKYFMKTPSVKYNKNQLLHTVRDRFTPVYAHIHKSSDVMEWFAEAGLKNMTLVEEQGLSIRADKI